MQQKTTAKNVDVCFQDGRRGSAMQPGKNKRCSVEKAGALVLNCSTPYLRKRRKSQEDPIKFQRRGKKDQPSQIKNMDDFRFAVQNHFQHTKMPGTSEEMKTVSSLEQERVEQSVANCYKFFLQQLEDTIDVKLPQLQRDRHQNFLLKGRDTWIRGYVDV